MATFTIPDEYEHGLARLLTLSHDSVKDLFSALESVAPSIRYRSIADRVASVIGNIPKEDLEDILEVLYALNVVRTGAEVPTAFFVDDICEAVQESDSELLKVVAERCDAFKQNLADLLESKTLEIATKSATLLREHEHSYCSARVLSDIRPIFSERVEDAPLASVIVHTLKVTYHQGEKLNEFFLAMNTSDVQKLRELLDRADAKAESLKSLLSASNTLYVDAE